MVSVVCFCDDCKWCTENGECNRGAITIAPDYECECFESYLEDYKETFYIAFSKDGIPHRRLETNGKKIEYKGYVFYTQDKITDSGNYFLTEARTGYSVGKFAYLEERWDKFLERIGTYPDVSTYPIEENEVTENE